MEDNNRLSKITFIDDETDEEVELFVIAETTLRGIKYLLVAEEDSGESDAYIFKETSESDTEIMYTPVEDDNEYEGVIKVFSELVEDADILRGSD